jgi:hypothetical protein
MCGAACHAAHIHPKIYLPSSVALTGRKSEIAEANSQIRKVLAIPCSCKAVRDVEAGSWWSMGYR